MPKTYLTNLEVSEFSSLRNQKKKKKKKKEAPEDVFEFFHKNSCLLEF